MAAHSAPAASGADPVDEHHGSGQHHGGGQHHEGRPAGAGPARDTTELAATTEGMPEAPGWHEAEGPVDEFDAESGGYGVQVEGPGTGTEAR